MSAFEFELSADRKPLEELVAVFFPQIESHILGDDSFRQNPIYTATMCLITKIFYMSNQVSFP